MNELIHLLMNLDEGEEVSFCKVPGPRVDTEITVRRSLPGLKFQMRYLLPRREFDMLVAPESGLINRIEQTRAEVREMQKDAAQQRGG